MTTNIFEHAKQQCEKYWHNSHARYSGIDVWLENTDVFASFTIRTFKIRKVRGMWLTDVLMGSATAKRVEVYCAYIFRMNGPCGRVSQYIIDVISFVASTLGLTCWQDHTII